MTFSTFEAFLSSADFLNTSYPSNRARVATISTSSGDAWRSHMEVSGSVESSCSSSSARRSQATLFVIKQVQAKHKGLLCFYMSNALTCSGKVHVKRMSSDSTRFMAMAAEIMLFFPPKAL